MKLYINKITKTTIQTTPYTPLMRTFKTQVIFHNNHTIHPSLGLRGSNSMIPSINHARNNKRFANAQNALRAFINIQSGLPESAILALVNLLTLLETIYYERPKIFVGLCKQLGNWVKVNFWKIERTQDMIPNIDWNSRVKVPHRLIECFSAASRLNPRDEVVFLRMLLSILDIYMVIVTPTQPRTNTITDPGVDITDTIQKSELISALENLGLESDVLTDKFLLQNQGVIFHSSSASGPNGQAVWNAHLDAKAVLADKEVKDNLYAMANLIGRKDLLTVLEDSAKLPAFHTLEREDYHHSKLHLIFEKGDKTRIIAILDYFTQELLTPLHNIIADILKDIGQDGTFDQQAIADKVKAWTSDKELSLYSFDLTAATDRLPILIQRTILDILFKVDGLGLHWAKLLTHRDFKLGSMGMFRYEVGQPMGAKSSFPMLGLTHHILVQIAALRAGFLQRFTEYVILGDDIVIADPKVAKEYQALMKALGLEISLYKSIISTTTLSTVPVAEICRRYFVKGEELTPIPMKLLANATENGLLFFQLQEKMQERGLIFNKSLWIDFAASIVRTKADWQTIGLYNSMPTWLTNFQEQFDFGTSGDFHFRDWEKVGVSEDILREFWKYTVISEQFKRISTLIQTANDGFKAISKGIQLGDIVFVGNEDGDEVTKSQFTPAKMHEWNILNIAHPARFVMLGEVNRISTIMSQLSSVRGQTLFAQLLSSVIDSLKYSILEIIKDDDMRRANLQRQLINKMKDNIQMCRDSQDKALNFTVKLEPLNIVWILKVNLHGSCTLSRSVSNISTTQRDAKLKLKRFTTDNSLTGTAFTKSKP